MKTAGLVLGIVGGALSILFALMFLFSGSMISLVGNSPDFTSSFDAALEDYDFRMNDSGYDESGRYNFDFDFDGGGFDMDYNDDNFDFNYSGYADLNAKSALDLAAALVWGVGIAGFIGGVLGIIGGAIIRKKPIASGVLLIIASVLALFTFIGIVSTIMMIIACVFAFIKEPATAPPAAPAPPAPMPPAPGQWPQP